MSVFNSIRKTVIYLCITVMFLAGHIWADGQPVLTYVITGNVDEGFIVTKNNEAFLPAAPWSSFWNNTGHPIGLIRADAGGEDLTIQFGNGTDVLNIGNNQVNFKGGWGEITLEGKLTSRNTACCCNEGGAIFIGSNITVESKGDVSSNSREDIAIQNRGALTVSGGTIEGGNLFSDGNVIINDGEIAGVINNGSEWNSGRNTLIITGGKITATNKDGIAITSRNNLDNTLTLSGNPEITGRIHGLRTGYLTAEAGFAPVNAPVMLSFAPNITDGIAVNGGAAHSGLFAVSGGEFMLVAEGANLVLAENLTSNLTLAAAYTITRDGDDFVASGKGVQAGSARGALRSVLNAIRSAAAGNAVEIDFADVNTGTSALRFENGGSGNTWGIITLSGKITSSAMFIGNDVNVASNADITTTEITLQNRSVFTISNGTVNGTIGSWNGGDITVSGGTVKGQIWSTGTLTISGGEITALNGVIMPRFGSILTISGGKITATQTNGIAIDYGSCCCNRNTAIILSGNPEIAGRIHDERGDRNVILTVEGDFAPVKPIVLSFNSLWAGVVAVKDAAQHSAHFTFTQNSDFVLASRGNDIVVADRVVSTLPLAAAYDIRFETDNFIARVIGGTGTGTAVGSLVGVINAIRTAANGNDVEIRFGSGGTNQLNIGSRTVHFFNLDKDNEWGEITLSGRITGWWSSMINISEDITVESKADVEHRIDNNGILTVSGGTIGGISSYSSGILTVSGGTIGTIGINSDFTLNGSPQIDVIWVDNSGKIIVGNAFAPGERKYDVNFDVNFRGVLIKGGAAHQSAFNIANPSPAGIAIANENGDIVVNSIPFIITGNNGEFAVTRGGNALWSNVSIQTAVDNIINSGSGVREIQFGNGTDVLNIGNASVNLWGWSWNTIILTGKITSSAPATIIINGNTNVFSSADIANTNTDEWSSAIFNEFGTLTINSGTISGQRIGIADFNGTITINGGTIRAEATNGHAIWFGNDNTWSWRTLTLNGNPDIVGRIRIANVMSGSFSVGSGFNPGEREYLLDFSNYDDWNARVINAANFGKNFKLVNNNFVLLVNGNDLRPANKNSLRTVTFDLNGGLGEAPENVIVGSGWAIPELLIPSAKNFIDGKGSISDGFWYIDKNGAAGEGRFNFNSGVWSNITHYLGWRTAAVSIENENLPNGAIGTAYSAAIVAKVEKDAGGTLNYTWTGAPTGLVLNAQTGAISGTPTVAGEFKITVFAINTSTDVSAAKEFTITTGVCAHTFGEPRITAATCTAEGFTERTCSKCQHISRTDIVPATNHTFTRWTIITAATCHRNGLDRRSCATCGALNTAEDATRATTRAHTWGNWTITRATCTKDGEKTRVCTIEECNAPEKVILKAHGHTIPPAASPWIVTIQPTVDAEGEQVKYCELECCGDVVLREAIAKLEPSSIHNVERRNERYGIKFVRNIVSDKAEMRIVLPDNERIADANIVIYDMTGNVVFASTGSAATRRGNSGTELVEVWDLRNNNGRFVGNGTYLVVAEVKSASGKVFVYSTRLGINR